MTSQPDKLFHENLEHYKKSPPPQAWERIQVGLDRKKSRRIPWRAAAAILVLFAAGITLWYARQNQTTMLTTATGQSISSENSNNISVQTPVPSIENEIAKDIPFKSKQYYRNNQSNTIIQTLSEPNPSTNHSVVVTPPAQSENPVPQYVISSETEPLQVSDSGAINTEPGITYRKGKLIYTTSEVNARFLKPQASVTELSNEKPAFGFQKIVDLATAMKYDETAYGDLRHIKNNILSLPAIGPSRNK